MDAKKFVVGSIVGGIVLFGVGYLLFQVILGGFFDANRTDIAGVERMPPLFWAVGVGCVLEAALITYALGARSGAATGAKVGVIVGLLLWGASDFIIFGFTNLSNLTVTIVDPLVSAVGAGVTGAIIGLIAGKMKSA